MTDKAAAATDTDPSKAVITDLQSRLVAAEAAIRKLQADVVRLTSNDDRLGQDIANVRGGL